MSVEPEKRGSFLAPLAEAYEPTEVDADRVFATIQASLAGSTAAPSPETVQAEPATPAAAGTKKTLAVGISAAVIAIAGALWLVQAGSETVAQPQPQPGSRTSSANAAPPAERQLEGTPAIPSVSVDALPSVIAQPVAPSTPKATPSAALTGPAPSADTLEREARLLADARRARQAGDGDRALSLLDEHAREFPRGWLASDRAAERILALCTVGRRDEAVREAAVFLNGRPKSPLTRRVEMSCAGQP